MNQQGQEFSGFRLLIEAILVLMILAIIISILGWVEGQRYGISEKRLFEGFDKAVNSPNGRTVVENDITLRKDSYYTSGSFAERAPSIPRECISFEALPLASLELSSNNGRITIKENLQLDMFYKCQRLSSECSSDCETCCKISFGREFSEGE